MEAVLTAQYHETLERLLVGEIDGTRMQEVHDIVQFVAAGQDRELRTDALLFLLINLQFMLSEPYSDYPRIGPSSELDSRLIRATEIILENLRGEPPYSSHAVLLAVESSWDDLASLFLWA